MPDQDQEKPVESKEPVQSAEPGKSRKIWYIVLFFFGSIFLIAATAAVVFAYMDMKEDKSDDEANEEENEQEEEHADKDLRQFEGEYVDAEVPLDWSVTEYENGDGDYGQFSEGTYTGLTAIVVRNEDGEDVFVVEGTNGIGGIDACEAVYRFDDTSAAYVTEMLETSEIYYPGAAAQDIDGEYTNFEFLGKDGRLMDDGTIYWDSSDAAAFDPHCNALINLPDSSGLEFGYSYMGTSDDLTSYMISVGEGLTPAESEKLVAVLESIVVL